MMMKDNEAFKKRCCGPSGCGEFRSENNRYGVAETMRYCIGSACAGWRWRYNALRDSELARKKVHIDADNYAVAVMAQRPEGVGADWEIKFNSDSYGMVWLWEEPLSEWEKRVFLLREAFENDPAREGECGLKSRGCE